MSTAQLPARFTQPLTQSTMAELIAHNELLNMEAERVGRVCAYFMRHGLVSARVEKPTLIKRKAAA